MGKKIVMCLLGISFCVGAFAALWMYGNKRKNQLCGCAQKSPEEFSEEEEWGI